MARNDIAEVLKEQKHLRIEKELAKPKRKNFKDEKKLAKPNLQSLATTATEK